MLRSFQIGKLFDIPLYLHTTFFLLPAWMLLANSGAGPINALFVLIALAAVFSCVVLHELGHALMARFFGIGTDSITLYPIGGVARLRRMSDKPFEEICIALAGPAVNLVLAAILAPLVFVCFLLGVRMGVTLYNPHAGLGVALGRLVSGCGAPTCRCFSSTCCHASRWTAAVSFAPDWRCGKGNSVPPRSRCVSAWW